MHNHIPADLLSPADRIDEVASILAAGVRRLRQRKSGKPPVEKRKVVLDFPAGRSSDVHDKNNRKERTWQDR